MSGRRTDGRVDLSGGPGRPVRVRPAPLAAAADPVRGRARARTPEGPVRGFVRRYGWRAYAIPFLTLVTLFALVDVAVDATPGAEVGATSSEAGLSSSQDAPAAVALPDPGTPPAAPAQGDAEPSEQPARAEADTYVEQGAGTVSVVDGSSPVYGSGPLRRFVVEVEDGIEVDGAVFAQAVEGTLADSRSWGGRGDMSFQRVGVTAASAGEFDFRVSLVSPGSMETYCPGVGTGGYTSCRYGERAVINLARWMTAVPHYEGDVETYRRYVVNHEVGHALGNRAHPPCPGPGQLAPVMQQQTLGLEGCTKNAWPYP
ncbi:Protein of unknown function [Blastococcus aggregatus]|uniref:DUF3152 domain-containing protein n=1 Tax=Blastococcus aggregatus TaxID=38502 RepID=A0A285V4C6_9ACTN|nr:DUF3152 domain-containing protein [Blastococcus aggregatus]SOC48863.1 Protein of unknown function [Blastococcus aggregatus]